jgi:hypothetical protein
MRGLILLLLLSGGAQARDLNFTEAHLLRLSSQQEPLRWLLPFRPVQSFSQASAGLFVSSEKEVPAVYRDIQSRDEDRIESRLLESYGRPYDASAKLFAQYHWGQFTQSISVNAGAAILITDPVFPEVRGFLFNDYLAATAYTFRPYAGLMLRPQVSYGLRRYLDREFTVGNLVDSRLDVNLSAAPYLAVAEFNLIATQELGAGMGELLFEIASLPLNNVGYAYWETFLGYRTPDFFQRLYFYGGYSPFYGGDYDVNRTFKVGANMRPWEWLSLDLFTMDRWYPAAVASVQFKHLQLDLFTFERAFDHFEFQRARQYGLALKLGW